MAIIRIVLKGTDATTESIGYFLDAIKSASGHSGETVPLDISDACITAEVQAEE